MKKAKIVVEDLNLEKSAQLFWEECDLWVENRLNEIASQGKVILEEDSAEIESQVEDNINSLLQKGIKRYGESFPLKVLNDLHHLFFELELKNYGIKNEEQIHQYKDNGQLGLSVVQGKIEPEHALLIMEVNRAHLEKKGGSEEAVCENCICGKKA